MMHLIISIAMGIFGGLWLFTKWGEWRVARWERRETERLNPKPLTSYQERVRYYEREWDAAKASR